MSIDETGPDIPVSDVVRAALSERLRVVAHYLPLAAKRPQENHEYVHQLRVATRRALAAMELFENLLPTRRARRMKGLLKRLRRTSGDARDLDVLADRLARNPAELGGRRSTVLLHRIAAYRRAAQRPIAKLHARLGRKRLERKVKALVRKVRWRGAGEEPSLLEAARSALQPLVEDFFTAANADLSDIGALHRMRICGKKLRYALELSAGAFESALGDELIPAFEEIQDRLGAVHDLQSAQSLFARWVAESGHGPEGIPMDLQQRVAASFRQFLDWWNEERSDKLRQQFNQLLGRPAPNSIRDYPPPAAERLPG